MPRLMNQNYEVFRYIVRQGDVCRRLDYDLDFSFRAFFAILDLCRCRHETNPNRLTTHLLRKFVINKLVSVDCYNSGRFKCRQTTFLAIRANPTRS